MRNVLLIDDEMSRVAAAQLETCLAGKLTQQFAQKQKPIISEKNAAKR